MPGIDKFKQDFALWEWMLTTMEGRPQADVEEIRLAIRGAWDNPELRQLWIDFVAEKARVAQDLRDIGKGSLERIKQRIANEAMTIHDAAQQSNAFKKTGKG